MISRHRVAIVPQLVHDIADVFHSQDAMTGVAISATGGNHLEELAQTWAEDICSVNLSARKVGADAASELAEALRASQSITTVDCSLNPELGDAGAKLLVPALRDDGTGISTVRSLSLMRCAIGDIGENTS